MAYYKFVVDDFEKIISTIEEQGVSAEEFTKEGYKVVDSLGRNVINNIFGGNMRTVHHVLSIRTSKSNKAVVVRDSDMFMFVADHNYDFDTMERPIIDTAMLFAKNTFNKVFRTSHIVKAIRCTAFYPVGASVINEQVYVLSHIIVDDEALDSGLIELEYEYALKPIAEFNSKDKVSESALKKLQIYVKE